MQDVQGMQGVGEKQLFFVFQQPRTSPERTYEIFVTCNRGQGIVLEGGRALSEAAGRVCAVELTWP